MLSHLQNKSEASHLIEETITEWFEQYTLITTRLQYTQRAIETARLNIENEDAKTLQSALLLEITSKYFEGADISPHDDSHKVAASVSATAHLNGVLSFVGSMALVYSHSYFEELLMRCFRIFTLADPSVWNSRLEGKKSTLGDLKKRGFTVITDEKLNLELSRIEKESIIEKIRTIESFIRSPHSPSPVKDYIYDKDEIERINKLRHDHAHCRLDAYNIEDAKNDVEYLLNSALHFFALTQQKVEITGKQRPVD